MRIGYDARILAHPKSGIATYLINLIDNLVNLSDVEIVIFSDKPIYKEYLAITNKVRTIIFGQRHRKYWAQFRLPRQLRKERIDLYHAVWNNAAPIFTNHPIVLTIHDLIPWNVRGYFTKFRKRVKYILQEYVSIWRANLIITPSEFSKRDIVQHLGISEEKIRAIYYGLEDIFRRDANKNLTDSVLNRYNINKRYFINGGGIDQPRRNIRLLLKAFYNLINREKVDIDLALVGSYHDTNKEYLALVKMVDELGIVNRVKFLGHVPAEDLVYLLRKAEALVLPSLYEGFGIPILEAMACGTPVIASNVTSIPEVAGDAAILVDPYNEDELTEAIRKIYFDSELRNELITKGYKRASEFSWQKAAEQTLSAYRDILNYG